MKKLLFFTPLLLLANNIENIQFVGLKHISTVSAKDISLLQKGDELNLEKVDKTIKKFYSYGYFKNIKVKFENGTLKYIFTEKPSILKIEYKNVSNDLKELLKDKIKRGMIFSDKKLEEIRNFIVTYYDAKGEFNTVVVFDKKFQKNGVILTINVNKGLELIINKLKFWGAKKESPDDIKDEIVNKDKDILGWLPFRNNGKFELRGLLTDTNSIKDYYLSKGYLDVKVSNPLFVANFDNNKADLEYKIYEGNRYKVGKVDINITQDGIIDTNKFKDDLLLISGLYFNINRVKKDIKLLKKAIADKGYAYVIVYPDIKKDKKNKIANITYKIIPGKKVYISDVIIKGNTKTLDRVIRRNVYLSPGYLYSLTDKEDTINALKRTGYFEDVKLKEIKIDDTHMKILIKVKEGLTGSLKAGISYNSYSKFGVNLSVTERNVFGSGQSLSIAWDKTTKSSSYSVNLSNPRVFDSKYSLSTSIYKKTFEGYSYTSDKKGFAVSVGKKLTRHTNGYVTYGYEKVKLTDITEKEIYYKPDSTKSYISPGVNFNNTDDHFFPQHGMNLGASIEYAGVGGDQKFIKNSVYAKFFYSLEDRFDILTILKYKFKAATLMDNGYLPINERFYLGGLGSVRGYDYGSIAPKDSDGELIGGKKMMLNSAEISVPVSIKKKMWLSAFIDNGRIGKNNMDIVRSSYGVSFDWITPIGPLNFTWAKPIGDEDDDKVRRFEFSIGSGF